MAEPAANPPAAIGTRYVILTFDPKFDNWSEAGDRIAAASANAAIRQHSQAYADGSSGTSGTYVAVPERSWKPTKVTVETTKTIRLG